MSLACAQKLGQKSNLALSTASHWILGVCIGKKIGDMIRIMIHMLHFYSDTLTRPYITIFITI